MSGLDPRALDAHITREGPEHRCDPHAPFSVVTEHLAVRHPSTTTAALVYDDRDPDAPPVVRFLGRSAGLRAAAYAGVRNRLAPPPNEDGTGGFCTVCGDLHGEPSG